MLQTFCCEDVAPGRTFPCSDAHIKLQYDLKMIKTLKNKTQGDIFVKNLSSSCVFTFTAEQPVPRGGAGTH